MHLYTLRTSCIRILATTLLFGGALIRMAFASDMDPQLRYLTNHFSTASIPGSSTPATQKLVLSYRDSNRSLLEDQALAAIAFVRADQRDLAEKILNSLVALQSPDGSWPFQFESDRKKIVAINEDIRPAGSVAWAALAFVTFERKYSSTQFEHTVGQAFAYLSKQRTTVTWAEKTSHPIRYSSDRRSRVSFEHNLLAYAAFSRAAGYSNDYGKIAEDLRTFLESMWDGERFYGRFDTESGEPDRDEVYLNTQSWALLILGPQGSEDQDFTKGLKNNCTEFFSQTPVAGFVQFHPRDRAPATISPIWSEGTFGMMMAMKIAGLATCAGKQPADLQSAMNSLISTDGGVAYSTPSLDPDFSSAASVAGTVWQYFVRQQFNPFTGRTF